MSTDWRKKCFELYKSLDDIDTADDIAKSDEKLYRYLVREFHKNRFAIIDQGLVNELYDDFYDGPDGLMQRNLK